MLKLLCKNETTEENNTFNSNWNNLESIIMNVSYKNLMFTFKMWAIYAKYAFLDFAALRGYDGCLSVCGQ